MCENAAQRESLVMIEDCFQLNCILNCEVRMVRPKSCKMEFIEPLARECP